MKKELTSNSLPAFDYSTLKQRYPELKHCYFFENKPKLIFLICEIMSTEKRPSHEEVQILKQRPLGNLIS